MTAALAAIAALCVMSAFVPFVHLYAAVWFIATAVMWVFMPVVFKPTQMPTPLFPWWPSAGIFTTIFLIGGCMMYHQLEHQLL